MVKKLQQAYTSRNFVKALRGVSKELYKFFDREGNTLVLRPDFTPSVSRACATYFSPDKEPVSFFVLLIDVHLIDMFFVECVLHQLLAISFSLFIGMYKEHFNEFVA